MDIGLSRHQINVLNAEKRRGAVKSVGATQQSHKGHRLLRPLYPFPQALHDATLAALRIDILIDVREDPVHALLGPRPDIRSRRVVAERRRSG